MQHVRYVFYLYLYGNVCVLTRLGYEIYVSLSTLQQWARFDGYFDIEALFEICIQLFTADPNDPWAVSTLKFLTE